MRRSDKNVLEVYSERLGTPDHRLSLPVKIGKIRNCICFVSSSGKVDLSLFFPGLLAMSLFFTASSVGPLITPWEKQAGTYERLLSFPVNINTIILGDIIAGMVFGILINIIVLIVGLVFLNYSVNILVLLFGILLSSFCFSSLGVLLASPSVRSPSHIMMFSSLIRFPLVFISGIL